MKNRNIKIEPAGFRSAAGSGGYKVEPRKSKLRLEGVWLREAGFRPGERVEVEVSAGVLTVRVVAAGAEVGV